MSFQHTNYNTKYRANTNGIADNEATHYGVGIAPATPNGGQMCWRVLGVHHLTPDENRSRHNAYVEVLDENGQRIKEPNLRVGWTWEGRSGDQQAPPKALDKPDNEPAGDVPIEKGMNLELWIEGDGNPSDRVQNMHTRHDDEPSPSGELLNTYGHHSYYVVFQRTCEEKAAAPAASPTSASVTPATGSLPQLLVVEGKRCQVVQFNADAALQKCIFADGFVPNSTEFTITQDGTQYIGQQAQHMASNEIRVYYVKAGDWGNVQFVTG